MNELTVIFQYGKRKELSEFCDKSIIESFRHVPYYALNREDCSNKTIGEGFNNAVNKVETDYVIWTPDDFAFFPNGNWVEQSINILKNRPDIGIIDLRKENDGETPWMIDKRDFVGDQSFYICRRWGDRRFNLTPFMMRTKDLQALCPLNENDNTGNIAEADGYNKWNKDLLMARLDIPYKGVCFHLGWNRSRYFGWEDK